MFDTNFSSFSDNTNQAEFSTINEDFEIYPSYSQEQITNLSKIINKVSFTENEIDHKKMKIFHRCVFPNCGRIFTSSGWLRSHFNEHIKEMKNNKFNLLFNTIINGNLIN